MTHETRIRLLTYWHRFPEAIVLAVLTATTTMILALLLSLALGRDVRDQEAATRCYTAQTVNMIRDIMEIAKMHELAARYPAINTAGLHCELYTRVPIKEVP